MEMNPNFIEKDFKEKPLFGKLELVDREIFWLAFNKRDN